MTATTRQYDHPTGPHAREQVASRAGLLARHGAMAGVVAAVTFPTALRVQAGPDLWWHVHTGQRIIEDRAVPAVDDLSYTAAGATWHNHEWLAQVLFAGTSNVAGGVGLTLLRALLFVATIAVLATVVQRRVQNPLVTLAIIGPATVFAEPFLNLRVHTFTYLLFVSAISVLDSLRAGARWPFWALPVMFVVWANLHGGFVLGLGIVGLTLLCLMASSKRPAPPARLVALGAACVAATLITPTGVGLYTYLATELGANHSLVAEWQPASGATLLGLMVIAAVVAGCAILARRLPDPAVLIVTTGSLVVALRQARFFVVVALIGAVAVADLYPALRQRLQNPRRKRPTRDHTTALASLGLLGAIVMALGAPAALSGLTPIDDGAPADAADFIAANDLGGTNIAAPLDWGGYLIARFDGQHLVAVDGRNLTVYDDDWVDRYLRGLQSGEVLRVDRLEATDVWLLRSGSAQVAAHDADPAWVRAYQDSQAVVFVRPGAWSIEPTMGPKEPSDDVTFPL